MKIAVVDYKAGNLRSVETALSYLNINYYISDDPEKLIQGDKMIFPGVGHAKSAMEYLASSGIAAMMKEYAATGRDLLGICLGSQILLESSTEGNTACLGIIKGECRKFEDSSLKIPHMGWNQVYPSLDHRLFRNIPEGSSFYFVHSYYTIPDNNSNELCRTEYGKTFSSGIYKDNVSAVQFHPEKSGQWGLQLLKNFAQ